MHANPTSIDPRANLERQRALAAEIINETAAPPVDALTTMAAALELADLVKSLDEWRNAGGYDPYMKERRETVRDWLNR